MIMSKRITQKVCLKFFQKVQDADGKGQWRCQGGKILKRQEGSGWTNLRIHLIWQQPDDAKQLQEEKLDPAQTKSLDATLEFVTNQAKNVHSWLVWVCNDLMPSRFVDLLNTRK